MRSVGAVASNPNPWRTRSLTGTFADPDVERSFVEHRLETSGPTLALAAAGAAVAWLLFIPTDRALVDSDTAWLAAAALRLVAAAALAAMARVLHRRPRWLASARGRQAVVAAASACAASFLGVCAVRPVAVENLHLSVVLLGTALVLFAPAALPTRASLCAAVYGGFVATAAVRFPADHVDLARLGLTLAAAAGGALVCALHLERTARTTYALLRREEEGAAVLARQAAEDPLTGLANRRSFFDVGAWRAEDADGAHTPLATVLLDLDDFKVVNDTHGHAAGDDALRQVARLLRDELRDGDLAGRLGGEEFAILLPGATLDDAAAVADRVRTAIEGSPLAVGAASISLTASVGVAARVPGEAFDASVRRADDAMYDAKRAGGNRLTRAAA